METQEAKRTYVSRMKLPVLNDGEKLRLRQIREQVRAIQSSNTWSNAEIARRAGIAGATFSEFMSDKYRGNLLTIADKIDQWLDMEGTALEGKCAGLPDIGFIETSISKRIITALRFAQTQPALVLLTLGSGLGKTTALTWYAANNPHTERVVIEPVEGSARAAIRKIAAVYDISRRTTRDIQDDLKGRLRRDGGRQPLLMIDEAQNLTDEAVNQLRFFLDECKCGIALAGNEDLMSRYAIRASREGYGQIQRRVFMRVHIKSAPVEDIDIILDKLGIDDAKIRAYSRQIGARVGGLGQVIDTLQLASLQAYSKGRIISPDDVRDAWANRSGEEIAR